MSFSNSILSLLNGTTQKQSGKASQLSKKVNDQISIMLALIGIATIIAIVYFTSPMVEVIDVVYSGSQKYKLSQTGTITLGYSNSVFSLITIAAAVGTIALVVLTFLEKPFDNASKKLYGICGTSVISILSVIIPLFILKGKAKELTTTAVRFTSSGTLFIIMNIVVIVIALLIVDKLKENS